MVERGVSIDFDLENTLLQIKPKAGNEDHQIRVYFRTAEENKAGGFRLYLTSPPRYFLSYCASAEFPVDLPSDPDKIWTVTLTRSSVIRIKIRCNYKEVLNVVLSDTLCGSNDWSSVWTSGTVKKIVFSSKYDTASEFYRPGKMQHYYC